MKLPAILTTALFASTALTAHAALVTWGAPTTISGDSDVVTTGTLHVAANFGPVGVSGTTINGVTFDPLPLPGGITTTTATPLSSDYLTLLNSAALLSADTLFTLSVTGLTIGENYLFQAWVNNSGREVPFLSRGDFPVIVSDGLGNDVSLYPGDNGVGTGPGDSNLPSVLGQYVTGTFTADATSQLLDFLSEEISGVVNGLQVRQVAPAAVPEPGTALAGLALVGLVGLRRRRAV
jgi:MYXO-CTERM domain-containing protein